MPARAAAIGHQESMTVVVNRFVWYAPEAGDGVALKRGEAVEALLEAMARIVQRRCRGDGGDTRPRWL